MINSMDIELLSPQKKGAERLLALFFMNLILGSVIFFIIGAQHKSIGFHADDYGIIYNGSFNNYTDINRIIYNGDLIIAANQPLDEPTTPRLSFLEVIYRPLLLLTMGLQRKICGLNPYYFHLIHTMLHVVVCLAIFNFIALYTHPIAGIISCLFFGLHTSLKDYFFWQCYIQNSLQAVLLVSLIFCLCTWAHTLKKRWLTTSLIVFLLALFLRETLLFFPLIPLTALFIFRKKTARYFELLNASLKISFFFGLPIFSYLMVRLWAYPFSWQAKSLGIKSLNSATTTMSETLRGKFFDILTCGFDMLGLKWLPSNAGLWLLKLSILILIAATAIWLWQNNPYKRLILLLLTATIVLSWPSWLLVHCSRYIYLGVLSLAVMIGLLVKPVFEEKSKPLGQYIFAILGLGFIVLQGYITHNALSKWVEFSRAEMLTIQSLAGHMLQNDNLILQNAPGEYLSVGYRAGLKLYGVKKTQQENITPKKTPPITIRWDPATNLFIEVDSK